MGRVVAVLLLALAGLAWFLQRGGSPGPDAYTLDEARQQARVVIQDEGGQGAGADGPAAAAMNLRAPGEITPAMVSAVLQERGNRVLVFQDGSELRLSPAAEAELSPDLRQKLAYQRGR